MRSSSVKIHIRCPECPYLDRIRVDGQAGKVAFVCRVDGIATLARKAGAA